MRRANNYSTHLFIFSVTDCNIIYMLLDLGINLQNYLVSWNSNYSFIYLNLLPSIITSSLQSIPPNTTIILEGCIVGTSNCLTFQNSNVLANTSADLVSFLSAIIQPILQCASYNVKAMIYLGSVGCYEIISLPQISIKCF